MIRGEISFRIQRDGPDGPQWQAIDAFDLTDEEFERHVYSRVIFVWNEAVPGSPRWREVEDVVDVIANAQGYDRAVRSRVLDFLFVRGIVSRVVLQGG